MHYGQLASNTALDFCNVRVDWHFSWQNNITVQTAKSCRKNMMFVLMQKQLLFKASFVKQFVAKYFYVFAIRISLWPSLVLHGQRDGHSNEEMAAMPKDRRMCMCVLHSLVFVECLHPSVAGECCNYMQLLLTSSNSTTHHLPFWPQFRQKPPRPPPTSQPSGISVCGSLVCVLLVLLLSCRRGIVFDQVFQPQLLQPAHHAHQSLLGN